MVRIMTQLIEELRKQDMIKWRQMKALEVGAAVLAETLMKNGVEFDMEEKTISWPTSDGAKSKAPKTLTKKGKSSGKSQKSTDAPGLVFKLITEKLLAEEKQEGLKNIGKGLS